jgi:hypothetical protein
MKKEIKTAAEVSIDLANETGRCLLWTLSAGDTGMDRSRPIFLG